MHIALAIIAALLAGSGDFCGGLGSRSNPVSSVGISSLGIGLVTALVLAPTLGGQLDQAAMVWGAVAGVAGGLAILFLYEGFTRSEVAVVSPVAAVGSATWPLIYAIASGERPGATRLIGLAIGVMAILLIGFQSSGDRQQVRDGVLLGSAAGLGFGSMLICLSLTGQDSGIWPLVPARGAAFAVLAVVATLLGRPVLPTDRSRPALAAIAGAGVLTVFANAAFVTGARLGSLSAVSVIASMFPAATVILARVVWKQRLTARSALGLGAALVAVALIAI